MTPTAWIGIDVSKRTFDAALAGAAGPGRAFERTPGGVARMLAWIDAQTAGPVRAVLEATGVYSHELAAWLLEARPSLAPAIVNPQLTCDFAKSLGLRNKTDRADARALARFGAERNPRAHEPLSPARENLRALSRERRRLTETLVSERLHASEQRGPALLGRLSARLSKQIEQALKEIDDAVDELIAGDEALAHDLALLLTIPGVGRRTALTILAELGDLRRFRRARTLSAFAGISPREHTSGTSVRRRTRLCKRGNRHARQALYMASLCATRGRGALAATYRRLVEAGKPKKSALGAVMRKLLVLMRAVLVAGEPFQLRSAT
jgi:transposase